MIIGLVRESVMQCFCHTCRAPLPPAVHRRQTSIAKVKTKPRVHQPKKVKFVSTEVRCQEKTRGGLCYEVILSEPEIKATPPKRPNSPPNKNMSIQDIEDKLRAAEERRQQLELNKVAALSAQIMKIEEATRKKDEQTTSFIVNTREALEQKMETHIEKREAYISDLKNKMKDHIETVEKTRLSLEQQCGEVRSALEEKMKTASAQREENIKKMLDRLKEHNEHHEEVKGSVEVIEEVRKTERTKRIETKLTTAELNREKEIQRKLEVIKKHERRAEVVRQNKANIIENQVVASSG